MNVTTFLYHIRPIFSKDHRQSLIQNPNLEEILDHIGVLRKSCLISRACRHVMPLMPLCYAACAAEVDIVRVADAADAATALVTSIPQLRGAGLRHWEKIEVRKTTGNQCWLSLPAFH